PFVGGRAVAGELLNRREPHALRPILDELLGGPACRRDAPAEVIDLGLRHFHREGLDGAACGRSALRGCLGDDGAFGIGNGHGLALVREEKTKGRRRARLRGGDGHGSRPGGVGVFASRGEGSLLAFPEGRVVASTLASGWWLRRCSGSRDGICKGGKE